MMRTIRLWIFLGAIWVARKACYNGLAYDRLSEAKIIEKDHYKWAGEDDFWN